MTTNDGPDPFQLFMEAERARVNAETMSSSAGTSTSPGNLAGSTQTVTSTAAPSARTVTPASGRSRPSRQERVETKRRRLALGQAGRHVDRAQASSHRRAVIVGQIFGGLATAVVVTPITVLARHFDQPITSGPVLTVLVLSLIVAVVLLAAAQTLVTIPSLRRKPDDLAALVVAASLEDQQRFDLRRAELERGNA